MLSLSFITAVLPGMSEHLLETEHSLLECRVAASAWRIEWIVVVDGPGEIPAITAADQIVRLPRRCGVSVARNFGLTISTGNWIAPLDGDDLLEPDIGSTILPSMTPGQPAAWIGANRLHMDGAKTPHWKDDAADWEPGRLSELWSTPFCFHPNSILVRRECALAVNGWPALPTNEDVAFALNLSEAYRGSFIPSVLNRYRVWDGQTIAQPEYLALKRLSFKSIEVTLNATRAATGRSAIAAPESKLVYTR